MLRATIRFAGSQSIVSTRTTYSNLDRVVRFASAAAELAPPPLVERVGTAAGPCITWSDSESRQQDNGKPVIDLQNQTRFLQDGSRICASAASGELRVVTHSDATTLFEAVRRGQRLSNDGRMLGYRRSVDDDQNQPYVWLRYSEVIGRSVRLAHGIRQLGLPAGQDTLIGLFSGNRPEWIIVEQAAYAFNNVLVPLYETLGADACRYIMRQADIRLAFCDTPERVESLLNIKPDCQSLEHIVLMTGRPAEGLTRRATNTGVTLHAMDVLERRGDDAPAAGLDGLQPPRPEDLCTICYTSGTTGDPKGVMLTHGNVMADATVAEFFRHTHLDHNDVMISFLPLAHMFERLTQTIVYSNGASVGFFRGDIRKLAEDIRTLRPTVIPVVPRVLNRLYDKVLSEVNKSVLKRILFNVALHFKTKQLAKSAVREKSLLDDLVFKPVRDSLGGRVKLLITGSAPISETVLNFVRSVIGCTVVEGYGQTECVAVCALTNEMDVVPGHVGVPIPSNAVKLIDVSELGYFASDQAGEICIRGSNVFRGYYKRPDLTREVLDADGWLRTGDIGRWTTRGTLQIVDRKKHILKLAQGEHVAPERIENVYLRSEHVAQCFVHGESLKTCLVAIVVPDPEVFIPYAKSKHQLVGSLKELCENSMLKAAVLSDLRMVGKAAGLCGFEQVKDIYLSAEPFTVANGLLTPTLKSKRPQLKRHFGKRLDEMYSRLD